ncbi:uncharacterized protein [Triticum aestivum]|uniref:uncharacterized protein isoform X2 n=1 Tax=Triticum aestivum TaxID=4565 RepID=UPI001D00E55D|nr:uncharacterized protein LOC123145856 isoform X2 [Triticum aestivum]
MLTPPLTDQHGPTPLAPPSPRSPAPTHRTAHRQSISLYSVVGSGGGDHGTRAASSQRPHQYLYCLQRVVMWSTSMTGSHGRSCDDEAPSMGRHHAALASPSASVSAGNTHRSRRPTLPQPHGPSRPLLAQQLDAARSAWPLLPPQYFSGSQRCTCHRRLVGLDEQHSLRGRVGLIGHRPTEQQHVRHHGYRSGMMLWSDDVKGIQYIQGDHLIGQGDYLPLFTYSRYATEEVPPLLLRKLSKNDLHPWSI